jgi:hypothetical protein
MLRGKKALLFCEQKRSKKNFIYLRSCWSHGPWPSFAKVFCFPGRGAFFSKKKRFLALATLFIAERVGGFAPVGHLYVFGLRFF